nr:MAG TPA: hypothetical protein [Caudoviricetes sp.]
MLTSLIIRVILDTRYKVFCSMYIINQKPCNVKLEYCKLYMNMSN